MSARQYPYVPAKNGIDISSIGDRLSSRCRSRLLDYSLGQGDITLEQDTKHVVCLTLPTLHEYGTARQDAMAKYGSLNLRLSVSISNCLMTLQNPCLLMSCHFLQPHSLTTL